MIYCCHTIWLLWTCHRPCKWSRSRHSLSYNTENIMNTYCWTYRYCLFEVDVHEDRDRHSRSQFQFIGPCPSIPLECFKFLSHRMVCGDWRILVSSIYFCHECLPIWKLEYVTSVYVSCHLVRIYQQYTITHINYKKRTNNWSHHISPCEKIMIRYAKCVYT